MRWLADAIRWIVASVLSFVGIRLANKTVFATAAIAAFVAMTLAFVAAVKLMIEGMAYALPAWAADWAGTFIPSNLATCIGLLVSVKTARWIFDYKTRALAMAAATSST